MASPINQDAAIALVNAGLHVFACNPDKTPMAKAWEQNATRSSLVIAATWGAHPQALPAIPVGAHSLVVIDADRKASGPDGVARFTALCAERSIDLSNTFVVSTPSGGFHFYFRADKPYGNSRGSLPEGIDVRGIGGYVIGPGATLPDGRGYKIIQGKWEAIPALPEPLAALLRERVPAMPPAPTSEPAAAILTDRDRQYAAKALKDEHDTIAAMRTGSRRNDALNVGSHSMGTLVGCGALSYQEAFAAMYDAAQTNGHLAKHGERQTRATIESGLNAGMLKPRSLPLVPGLPNIDVSGIVPSAKAQQSMPAHSKRSISLVQCAVIQAKPINWLWNGFIPQGKLTLLAGAGGAGKSTLAFNFAGTVSNGGIWPDGSRCMATGNVLIWSSEDDAADTINPRLMAVGANLTRCGIVSGATDENGLRYPFDPSRDMDQLREATQQIGGVSLLILDPIVTAITGDMNKANDVRRGLQTIVDYASETGCAVIGVTHFTKGTAGKNSAERVTGSQAFAAFARMVLVAAKEEDSDRRVFARAKSNNSRDTGGFSYTIEAVDLKSGITATRIVWGESLEGSSRSILAKVEGDGKEDGDKLRAAKQFLNEMLRNGPAPAKELLKYAREEFGITEDTLRRAYKEIGAKPSRVGFGSNGAWMWALP